MNIDKAAVKNILIIRLKGLGDILLSMPAVKALKEAYPKAGISVLVNREAEPLLLGLPFIDEIILYNRQKHGGLFGGIRMLKEIHNRKFDLVLDLIGNPRSALITALSGAKYKVGTTHRIRQWAYNIKVEGPKEILYGARVHLLAASKCGADIRNASLETEINIPAAAEESIDSFLFKQGVQNQEAIGLNPFTNFATRDWGPENFSALSDELVRAGNKVILLWGPGEEVEHFKSLTREKILLAPDTDIKRLAALLKRLKFVITTNTFIKHAAAAVKTPTLTIYGATNPLAWESADSRSGYMLAGVDCQPCEKNECADLKCLKSVSVQDVLAKLKDMPGNPAKIK